MLRILIFLLCVLSITATAAHSEHKLLITDVLDRGQFEVKADVNYVYSSYDFTVKGLQSNIFGMAIPIDIPGTQTRNTFSSAYSIGAGIGYGLQLSAAIPYVFLDNIKSDYNTSPPTANYTKKDGLGDICVFR